MKTLLSPYSEYRCYYPSFPESGVYRKQQFCVRSEVDAEGDAAVSHNTLSVEVLVLSPDEDTLWCSAPENGIKTDINDNSDTSARYGVQSIPTLMLFQ